MCTRYADQIRSNDAVYLDTFFAAFVSTDRNADKNAQSFYLRLVYVILYNRC